MFKWSAMDRSPTRPASPDTPAAPATPAEPATSTTPTSEPTSGPNPWATFAACALGFYLTTLDLSIVNVAFPDIVTDFGISRADASWIITVYNILYGSLLVVAGKTADSLGRRRLFRVGIALFALGSLIAAVAPGLGVLVAGRAVQGVGGAVLTPATLGLLVAAFPVERRTQIVALWGGIGALGVASGPSIGALAISLSDWRAAFWINLPLCLGLLVISGRVLAESARTPLTRRPDLAGAVLITGALAALALGLSRSEVWGWGDVRTVGSIGAGLVVAGLFVARQRVHPEPILDLSLFESRAFTVANFSGVAFFAGFAALGLNNVLFLRQAWGYDVLTAGLLSALAPLTVAALAPVAGRLAARHGFRPFVVVGPVIVASLMVAFTVVFGEERQPWLFVGLGELVAVGIALFIPVNSAAAVADLPPQRLSVGGAVNNTFRQVGSVLGVALLVSVIGSPATPGALVAAHHRGWLVIAGAMALTTAVSMAQRRTPTGPPPAG